VLTSAPLARLAHIRKNYETASGQRESMEMLDPGVIFLAVGAEQSRCVCRGRDDLLRE